jgi:hypothetical protein
VSACLEVLVRPRARRAGLKGFRGDGRLVVAVGAPPEDGRANQAMAELLGEALGVRARDVTIVSGEHSREKRVEVQGLDEGELKRRLTRALGGAETGRGE